MKYALGILAVLILFTALSAEACQNCKIDMYGCLECRESEFNGYQSCVIMNNGNTCQGQNGYCEGPGGAENCNGSPRPCPFEKWVQALPEKRDLQLAKVLILRAKEDPAAPTAGS